MSKLFESASATRYTSTLNMPKNDRRRKSKQVKTMRGRRINVTPHKIVQAFMDATELQNRLEPLEAKK